MTTTPKDRHPLRALSAAVLTAAVIGTIAVATLPAKAATTAPTLTAKLTHKGTQVVLHWKFTSDNTRQRDRKLEILRTVAGAGNTTFTKAAPGKTGSYTDKTPPAGATTYRARVLIFSPVDAKARLTTAPVPTETTPWSDPVSVDPETTPTTSRPNPTVRPTTVAPPTGGKSCPDSVGMKATFLRDLNAARAAKHVGPVSSDTRLDNVAYQRGDFFTKHGFDNHAGAGSLIGGTWAEVVAWGWSNETGAMGFWKGSQHHWPYMMSASYTRVGYACVMGNGGPWYTADFQG